MACICECRHNSESFSIHSAACESYNDKLVNERIEWERKRDQEELERLRWETQDHQCSGPGYSHKAHGKCSGWATDRT